MSRPSRPALLLLGVFLLIPPPLPGQRIDPDAVKRPSHRPFDIGLEDSSNPEAALLRRLASSRELKGLRDDDLLQGEARDLLGKLLKDPKLLDTLRDSFSREDLERLRSKVRQDGLLDDPALRRLLEGLDLKQLAPQDGETLRRWSDKLKELRKDQPEPGNRPDFPPGQVPPPGQLPGRNPPPPPGVPPVRPESTPRQETPEWLKGQLGKYTRDLEKWVESPSGQSMRDSLRDLARRYEQGKNSMPALGEQARGLGRYLPRLSNYLPRSSPRLPTSPLPGMPRFGMPRGTGLSGASLESTGKLVLFVAVFVVVGYFLWRTSKIVQAYQQARAAQWRPGPWPVRPGQVRTRGDLVRAYEHLALVLLGQSAYPHHHIQLARDMARLPALDPDRQREAAGALADLYEKARYTPDEERLAQQDYELANRELEYLARARAA